MSTWNRDFIDLVVPGHLAVKPNGKGTFAFGAIETDIDCRIEISTGQKQLAFSFAGWDEGDEVSGRGWARVDNGKMTGWFAFNGGHESTFEATSHGAAAC